MELSNMDAFDALFVFLTFFLFLVFCSSLLHAKCVQVCMLLNRYVLTVWQPPSEPCISVRPQADLSDDKKSSKVENERRGARKKRKMRRRRSVGGREERGGRRANWPKRI